MNIDKDLMVDVIEEALADIEEIDSDNYSSFIDIDFDLANLTSEGLGQAIRGLQGLLDILSEADSV